MTKAKWVVCGLLLAVTACTEAKRYPIEDSELTVEDRAAMAMAAVVPTGLHGGATTNAETCTVTETACHVGRCEFPNDTYMFSTEVCCTAPGVCETERYKTCGC